MAYSTGMMNQRITVAQKMTAVDGAYGRNSGGVRYEKIGDFWAAVDFSRGTKSLREGAIDAYDKLIIRMRYDSRINRDCIIAHFGRCYEILSLNAEYQHNTIQLLVSELPDRKPDFYEPAAPVNQ